METGIRARIDLIRIQAELAENAVRIIEAENSVRDRERELKQLLNKAGLGIETETVLIPSTEPTPIRYEIENERIMAKALNNRMDMLDLELQIAWDDSTIDKRRNEKLPSVDITYRYNMNGLGPARSDSYDMLYDNKYKDHRVDLEISVPLGNKAGKSRLRQAIYQRSQT